MIEWFARNPVAANLLMFTIVIIGLMSAKDYIPLETFPSVERDVVTIRTAFRGATPKSVEDGITTRIEEAIYDLEGIDEVSSRSSEGMSFVSADVDSKFDNRDILNDIKLRVDALNTLPTAAEKPIVSLSTRNPPVIFVAVLGNVGDKSLRGIADQVRNDLLDTDEITLVEFDGVKNYEISIEISPQTLDSYNLTLADVGRAIQQGSVDLSAGNLKTRDGDILIRSDGQAYERQEFANIPIVSNINGKPILLGDIATVTDGFEEQSLERHFDGKPAIMMEVLRVGDQSAIRIAETVRAYIQEKNKHLPKGVNLEFWDDDSLLIKDRLSTLINSGVQGGILVLLLLSLFLRPAVAFWVFLGIPVSFMGALICLALVGGTFNIVSLFAFILVLGIVVDDAIVTGENIYRRMRGGEDSLIAAIEGTKQIAVPVTFGILTTIVAFLPLYSLGDEGMGRMVKQIPLVVIPVLLMSLVESKLVLPAHLSHIKRRANTEKQGWLTQTQMKISRSLENFIEHYYQPFLKKCMHNKAITLTGLASLSIVIISFAVLGHIKFTFMPRIEGDEITFSLVLPDTTGFATTKKHIDTIAGHFKDLQEEYRDPKTGISIIRHIYTTIGSSGRTVKNSVGRVYVELIPPTERHVDASTTTIAREARKRVGEIPGAEKLNVRAETFRSADPINVELKGSDLQEMSQVITLIREKLKEFPSVFDIQDNFTGGKEELNISLKPRAHSLGLSLADVARQVRYAVFGFEAQRIQRGRDELRVMVRYPHADRSSVEDLYNLPIRIKGQEIPLSDIAIITPFKSPTSLYRLNRNNILNVIADIDKEIADLPAIMRDLTQFMEELKQRFPNMKYEFKGEAQEQADSNAGVASGSALILVAIFALLAIPFKSYLQPLIVMSVIPFSLVGATLGHLIFGINLSFLSIIGMLALVGVVINDSLVLVDYINKQRRAGVELTEAVISSGAARFRPVLLTSLTTFVGLMPLLLDKSTQAQFLKPMAISLGCGILFATLITLIVVPINYQLGHSIKYKTISLSKKLVAWWLAFWNKGETSY